LQREKHDSITESRRRTLKEERSKSVSTGGVGSFTSAVVEGGGRSTFNAYEKAFVTRQGRDNQPPTKKKKTEIKRGSRPLILEPREKKKLTGQNACLLRRRTRHFLVENAFNRTLIVEEQNLEGRKEVPP